jgi:hypothetical protein
MIENLAALLDKEICFDKEPAFLTFWSERSKTVGQADKMGSKQATWTTQLFG